MCGYVAAGVREVRAGWRRALSGSAPSVSPPRQAPAGTPVGRRQGGSLPPPGAGQQHPDVGDNEGSCVRPPSDDVSSGGLTGVLLTPGQVEGGKKNTRCTAGSGPH